MNTDDYAPEIKRLIKEFVNDYLRSPEFQQRLECRNYNNLPYRIKAQQILYEHLLEKRKAGKLRP